ncbi:MAG: hypothetical protein ACOCUT_00190 [bacterium]
MKELAAFQIREAIICTSTNPEACRKLFEVYDNFNDIDQEKSMIEEKIGPVIRDKIHNYLKDNYWQSTTALVKYIRENSGTNIGLKEAISIVAFYKEINQ